MPALFFVVPAMLDDIPLIQRRTVLAALTATATGLLASLPAVAEPQAPETPKIVVRRPWADFEAVRGKASNAATPQQAERTMLAHLGPLPWHFYGGENGEDVDVTSLASMAPPQSEGEATGVWAVAIAHKPGEAKPGYYMLILCGRIRLKMSSRQMWDRYLYEVPKMALGPLYGHVMWTMNFEMAVVEDHDTRHVVYYRGSGIDYCYWGDT